MADAKRLVEDAQYLGTYASSRGLLGDEGILDRIAAADEKVQQNQFGTRDEQDLNKVINTLSKMVQPVSIDELRSDPALRGEKLTIGGHAKRLLYRLRLRPVSIPGYIFLISILAMFAIIPWTALFHRLTAAVAELRETEQQDYFSIIYDARSLQNDVNTGGQAKTQQKQDLQAKIRKLREIQTKVNVNSLTITATVDPTLGVPRWIPVLLSTYGLGLGPSLSNYVATPTPTVQSSIGASTPPATTPNVTAQQTPPALPTTPATSASPAVQSTATTSATSAQTVSIPSPPPEQASSSRCAVSNEVCLNREFASSLGITIDPDEIQGAYLLRRQAESATALLAGSALPVLYGLLGAAVYLLRRFVMGDQQEPRPNAGMSAFLRLGLGGIAGLAIGWFWVPTSPKGVAEAANLTTTPFALAFLAGFSIEVLFSLLDRIIAAVNPSATPRPQAQEPEKPANPEKK